VGKVDAFTIPGLDLWFNSSDHLPPHFHARKPGTWEIRVYFLLCTEKSMVYDIKWPSHDPGPSRKEQERMLNGILENRVNLLREWQYKVYHEGE
jgi:hypothetical protein